MTTEVAFGTRSPQENWPPLIELAIKEVFEIMLGSPVAPVADPELKPREDFTAIVGLAGALCGILSLSCDKQTAIQIAKCMLGDAADSEAQVADALGEICNMVAGNFKNKLAGTDDRCMLSIPTVISGGEYTFHTMVEGTSIETVLLFENLPFVVRLQLQTK
jgi:chemotaxis protein CheX